MIKTVLLEAVPPTGEDEAGCRARLPKALEMYGNAVDAIDIPDVRDGEEFGRERKRMSQMKFAGWIKTLTEKPPILYRVVVHEGKQEHEAWMKEAKELGTDTIILVGGDSSKIQHSGITLSQGAELARSAGLNYGGIIIPTRRSDNPQRPANVDEVERIRQKLQDGYSCFFSQILYEGESTKRLLSDLAGAGTEIPRIYLGFSPVTDRGGIKFLMKNIGAYIPPDAEARLIRAWDMRGESSNMALEIWDGVIRYCRENRIPDGNLGINVEYVDLKNLKPALELAAEFARRLAKCEGNYAESEAGVYAHFL